MNSRAGPEGRPNPDALLALAKKAGRQPEGTRGRLKVFLGAAPGVGKTFALLQGAHRLQTDGTDVVIGFVETHGRAETAALIAGLEILPRRHVPHLGGRPLEEFDLDAALARRPALIIVDELAHTNAPDSRHPKRWQDVTELIQVGIDVWTALNIQHLESLADVVAGITGVTVRETVPDTVLQGADDVVLIDITPDELIERLHQGKIYQPETARRATQSFFTTGNLTALRELSLRRTADRVDDDIVEHLRRGAVAGPWRSVERLLVCVGPDAASETAVRAAGRLATGLNADWVALHAERLGARSLDARTRKRIADTMALATRLGGETTQLADTDIVGAVLAFARRENVTQIILGRSSRGWLARLLGRSLPDAVMRRSTGAVVIVGEAKKERFRFSPVKIVPKRAARSAASAFVAVTGAVGIGMVVDRFTTLPTLSMVFLMAVLVCGVFQGLWSAVLASLLSFLATNFFFVEPRYSFSVADSRELFALMMFLGAAILTGALAGRVRDQSAAIHHRSAVTQALYDFSARLSAAVTLDAVVTAAITHLSTMLRDGVVLLLDRDGELVLCNAAPPVVSLGPGDASAARWAFEKREAAGRGTGTLPSVDYQYRPLLVTRGAIGVVGLALRAEPLAPDDERAITASLDQTAIALDRSLLSDAAVRAAAMEDNEKLRTTLLASLSHDLRTPLAAITGAVTTLRQLGPKLSPESRDDLVISIEEETERLTRFVSNILDMSRIESGALKVRSNPVEIGDVVANVVERRRKLFPHQTVLVSIAADLPVVRGDAHLIEQALFNVVDNAQKYGAGSNVRIHARGEGSDLILSVTDGGPGVKPADLERIFEKFHRGRREGGTPGAGLGLSICRGLVEANGGTVIAQSPAVRRRGTRIVMRFPIAKDIA